MFDEFDSEDQNWRPAKSKFRVIAEKTLKYAFYALVFGLIALTIVRSVMSGVPSDMKKFVWNENSIAEYNSNDEFIIYQYLSTGSFTSDGLFAISHINYIPSIGQFQATIRYNNRIKSHIKSDFSLGSLPDGELFVFVLRDNNNNVYTEYTYVPASKIGYTFRRVIFENVSMDDVTYLALDIYYIGDVTDGKKVDLLYMYRYDYDKIKLEYTTPEKSKTFDIISRPDY